MKSEEFYSDEIAAWANKDAYSVVIRNDHTPGYFAKYRLGIIKGYKKPLFKLQPELKEQLYKKYNELLKAEIRGLDSSGRTRRWTVPTFDEEGKEWISTKDKGGET